MIVEEDGYAIAILFNELGIRLDKVQHSDDRYEKVTYLKGSYTPDTGKAILQSFQSVFRHSVNCLPLIKHQLIEIIQKFKMDNIVDGHEKLRKANFVDEAYLFDIFEDWVNLEDSMFSLKLISLKNNEKQRDEVKLIRHHGSEIFIPLSGSFKILTTGIKEGDSIETDYCLGQIHASEINETIISGMDETKDIPSILILNSETPHTFIGVGEGAVCLHIRIRRHVSNKAIDNMNNVIEVPVTDALNTYIIKERK